MERIPSKQTTKAVHHATRDEGTLDTEEVKIEEVCNTEK